MNIKYQLTEHWFRKHKVLATFDNYPTFEELKPVLEENFDGELVGLDKLDRENILFYMKPQGAEEVGVELLIVGVRNEE